MAILYKRNIGNHRENERHRKAVRYLHAKYIYFEEIDNIIAYRELIALL